MEESLARGAWGASAGGVFGASVMRPGQSVVMDRKTVADVAMDVVAATLVVVGAGIAVALCFALLTALVAISSPGNPTAVAFGWVLYVGMGVLIRPWDYLFWAPLRSALPCGGRSVGGEHEQRIPVARPQLRGQAV